MLDFFHFLLELVNSFVWSKDSTILFAIADFRTAVRSYARKVEVLGLSSNKLEEAKVQ